MYEVFEQKFNEVKAKSATSNRKVIVGDNFEKGMTASQPEAKVVTRPEAVKALDLDLITPDVKIVNEEKPIVNMPASATPIPEMPVVEATIPEMPVTETPVPAMAIPEPIVVPETAVPSVDFSQNNAFIQPQYTPDQNFTTINSAPEISPANNMQISQVFPLPNMFPTSAYENQQVESSLDPETQRLTESINSGVSSLVTHIQGEYEDKLKDQESLLNKTIAEKDSKIVELTGALERANAQLTEMRNINNAVRQFLGGSLPNVDVNTGGMNRAV